ncbi:uncharacterized protein [Clytia hemisphaerica]|uniref:Uncharacterized protein n=1 Tax=Clytia hemisphaerica TaxID=252671 RepID=A0A7M5X9J6_9CNID|eukprot:TCONS_00063700-protein
MARIISIMSLIKYGIVFLSIALNLMFMAKLKQGNSSKSIVHCQEKEDTIFYIQKYITELLDVRVTVPKKHTLRQIVDQHFNNVQQILKDLNFKDFPVIHNIRKIELPNKLHHYEKMNKATKNSTSFPCLEAYLGFPYGNPLYNEGFRRTNCQNISQRLSLVIDRPIIDSVENFRRTLSFAKGRFKKIHIVLQSSDYRLVKRTIQQWMPNVAIQLIKQADNVSLHLNKIVQKIDTEYVVIASQVVLINEQFDIIRMVQVYESLKHVIVASSIKNYQSGKWETGCYQTALKPYRLTYWSGYRESQKSCLKCDFVKGAFLLSPQILKKNPFRGRQIDTLYADLFLRLQKQIKIFTCPDVMVYINSKERYEADEIGAFNMLWNFEQIQWYTLQTFQFPCPANFKGLVSKCRVGKGMAAPPCCLEMLYDGMEFVTDLFDRYRIQYMLIEGSVLGAVKFNGISKWEQDADIAIKSKDFTRLLLVMDDLNEMNYTLVIDQPVQCCHGHVKFGGVAHIRVFHWSIQIYGFDSLGEVEGAQTNIEMGNGNRKSSFNAKVAENPGRYSRNRYGSEVFQHAEHWMKTGKKDGWQDYESGKFEECSKPGHHACLDQFVADGSFLRGKI